MDHRALGGTGEPAQGPEGRRRHRRAGQGNGELAEGPQSRRRASVAVVRQTGPDRGKGPSREALYSLSLLFLCN